MGMKGASPDFHKKGQGEVHHFEKKLNILKWMILDTQL